MSARSVSVLTGEPGIGKTRLLAELRRRAEPAALDRPQWTRERVGAGELPYGAVVDALDPLPPRAADALPPAVRDGLAALPAVRRPEPAAPAARDRPGRAGRPGRRPPLLLVLDDLHWADGGTVELLAHLLRNPGPAPVLLALAYRPRQVAGQLAAAVDAAAAAGGLTRVELGPLGPADAARLLGRTCRPRTPAGGTRPSGGNPLYLARAGRRSPAAGRAGRAGPGRSRRCCGRPRCSAPSSTRSGCRRWPGLPAAAVGAGAGRASPRRDLLRAEDGTGRLRFRHPLLRTTPRTGRRRPDGAAGAHARAAVGLRAAGVPLAGWAHHVERSAAAGDEQASGAARPRPRRRAGGGRRPPRPAGTAPRCGCCPPGPPRTPARCGPAAARPGRGALRGRRPRGEPRHAHRGRPAAGRRRRRRPGCAPASLAARVEQLRGRHEEAVALLHRALATAPGADEAAALALELATAELLRGDFRGGPGRRRPSAGRGRHRAATRCAGPPPGRWSRWPSTRTATPPAAAATAARVGTAGRRSGRRRADPAAGHPDVAGLGRPAARPLAGGAAPAGPGARAGPGHRPGLPADPAAGRAGQRAALGRPAGRGPGLLRGGVRRRPGCPAATSCW